MHAEGKAMMERGILKAQHRLMNPDAKAETYWWLSFAGDTGNLGCALVVADDFAEAVAASHLRGINPGGEVQGTCIVDDGTMNPELVAFHLNKLRTKAEMDAVGIAYSVDREA